MNTMQHKRLERLVKCPTLNSNYESNKFISCKKLVMNILNLIEEADKSFTLVENHPAKKLPLEEQVLYLSGLCLPMVSDGIVSEKQKDYIHFLIKLFGLDESCLDDVLAFSQSPDKETIRGFFACISKKANGSYILI